MALSAYRHLLRATRIAFQGDVRLLTNSRLEARKGFDANRHVAPGSEQAVASIAHAEDIANLLRRNIVQGKQIETGDGQSYKLRIHEEIERGDNDTVKLGALGGSKSDVGCCSQ